MVLAVQALIVNSTTVKLKLPRRPTKQCPCNRVSSTALMMASRFFASPLLSRVMMIFGVYCELFPGIFTTAGCLEKEISVPS